VPVFHMRRTAEGLACAKRCNRSTKPCPVDLSGGNGIGMISICSVKLLHECFRRQRFRYQKAFTRAGADRCSSVGSARTTADAVVDLAQRLCIAFDEPFVGVEVDGRYIRIYGDIAGAEAV
jgi:hypothetical protein